MFRAFGHEPVAVLDGGFQKWRAEGRRIARGVEQRPRTVFRAHFRPDLVRSLEQVAAAVGSDRSQLLDARSAGRFEGREPEPRAGVRAGHIPGAKNLPYSQLTAADGTLLPPEDLEQRYRDAGIDLDRDVILSCGSGVSACALALGLEQLGRRHYAVYDGSWTEWGGRSDTPVETGRP
jgi:thiosulfate/3-mercaptopyruvate sulfurtransferase